MSTGQPDHGRGSLTHAARPSRPFPTRRSIHLSRGPVVGGRSSPLPSSSRGPTSIRGDPRPSARPGGCGRTGGGSDGPGSPPGLASPSPVTTQPGQPGPCSPDGSQVVFLPQAEAVTVPAATADYRFQGSLGSMVGVATDLVEIGEGTGAFTDEGMIGRAVLSFARGSGLSLSPTTGVIEGTEYTIEILFRFDRLDGYRK